MKKNSFSAEEVKSRKGKGCAGLGGNCTGSHLQMFVTQEVTALAVSEHLAHPAFFSLHPADLSLPKFLKPTLIVTEHMKG